MVVSRRLLRQSRSIFSSISPLCNTSESIASQFPRIQSRLLHLDNVQLNLPPEAADKDVATLFKEGYINENVARWLQRERLNNEQNKIGARVIPSYHPRLLNTRPPTVHDVTLELLLASQSHLGHATSLWHPGNARYIFGVREGIHIISLEVTAAHLRRAARVIEGVADQGGLILFVGTRRGQERAVVNAAKRADGCHLFDRWIPGTLTNGGRILERCQKKVLDQMDRRLLGFELQLTHSRSSLPDLVVCLNPRENHPLLHECALNNIPTVGVVDTNTNPTWVTYPIPANDDSLRCINVIAGVLGQSAETGRKQRLARAKDGEVLPFNPHQLVMPESFQDEAKDQNDENVLDLRNKETIGAIRYAEPPETKKAATPKKQTSPTQSDKSVPPAVAERAERSDKLRQWEETIRGFQQSEVEDRENPDR